MSSGNQPVLLVVDDDPQTAALLREWYTGGKYEILAAPDGHSGLALARERRPDLILLDVRMPGLDGVSVARMLNNDPLTAGRPIVLLSACRDSETKTAAFDAGAWDYVTKPFECQEIAARIESILLRTRSLRQLKQEVTVLRSNNDELEKLLMTDDKTGLANFREFQRRLVAEFDRSARYRTPLSLIFLDLDHFKQVNDTLGHQAGDQVLQEFAVLVEGGARSSDVAARYGGEEFAIVLPHTEGEMGLRVAERILAAVREFVFLADLKPTHITVSAGVATFAAGDSIDSADTLLRAADRALYRAKESGRDRVVFEVTPVTGNGSTANPGRSADSRQHP